MAWIDVAALADLPAGRGRVVFAEGRVLAAFRVGEEVHVLDDSCPHAGASLASGKLEGCRVRCPAHGLTFDLRDGCRAGPGSLSVPRYPARIEAGRLLVQTTIGDVAPSTDTIAPVT